MAIAASGQQSARQSKTTLPLYALLIIAGLVVAALAWGFSETPKAEFDPLDASIKMAYGPRNFSEAYSKANNVVLLGQERVRRAPDQWAYQESRALSAFVRAQLTGSFDDYAAATAAIDIAMAEAPKSAGPALSNAVINLSVHRNARAAAALSIMDGFVVPPDPADTAEAAALRGDIAFYNGQYAAALRLYKKAAVTSGGTRQTFRLANWYKHLGQPDRAASIFRGGASVETGRTPQLFSTYLLQLGSIALMDGRWSEAERYFARANAVFPGYWLAQAHLAQMLAVRGDMAGAKDLYLDILSKQSVPEVMDALASLYRSQGQAAEAREWADGAAAIWNRRLQLLPEAAYGHAVEHELALGDPARALMFARKDYAQRPFGETATMLGWALLANNKAEEARAVLEGVNATGWTSASTHAALAEAYALLGRGKASDAERDAATALNPKIFDPAASLIWFGHH
ncbi:MAG: hypothetical protein U5J78_03130 [Parasphingorhabdus sp.]|nr:hypothetical protein [Parasphingorhabdus sp.]